MRVLRVFVEDIVVVEDYERKNLVKSFYHSNQVIIVLLIH